VSQSLSPSRGFVSRVFQSLSHSRGFVSQIIRHRPLRAFVAQIRRCILGEFRVSINSSAFLERRVKAGADQWEVAHYAGISPSTVSGIEVGKSRGMTATLMKIDAVLTRFETGELVPSKHGPAKGRPDRSPRATEDEADPGPDAVGVDQLPSSPGSPVGLPAFKRCTSVRRVRRLRIALQTESVHPHEVIALEAYLQVLVGSRPVVEAAAGVITLETTLDDRQYYSLKAYWRCRSQKTAPSMRTSASVNGAPAAQPTHG
jgi:DNA-binding XRE family transcriptional regulator